MTSTLLSVILLSILLSPFLPVFVAGSFGMSMPDRLRHLGLALLPFVYSNVYREVYRNMVAQLRPRLGVQELKELEAFELEYDTSTRNERIILFTPLTEMGASTIFSASLIAAAFSLLAYLQFYEGTPIAPFAFFVAFWLWWPSILRVGHLMSMPLRRMFAGTTARGTFWSVMSFRMMLQLILLLFSVGSGVLLSLVLVPAATLSMAYKSYRFLKTLRDACASL